MTEHDSAAVAAPEMKEDLKPMIDILNRLVVAASEIAAAESRSRFLVSDDGGTAPVPDEEALAIH